MNKHQILKEGQISNVTKITNEPKIKKKEHKISKQTQITNEPKILKDHQISKQTPKFIRSLNFQ